MFARIVAVIMFSLAQCINQCRPGVMIRTTRGDSASKLERLWKVLRSDINLVIATYLMTTRLV